MSECRKLEVFSKTPNTTWRSKRLDIQELKDKDATELDDIEETSLPSYYEQVKAIIDKEKGTIVSWKECDRLDRQFAKTLYERAESILGRVFRYHLAKGLKIILEIYEFNETENTYNATFSPKHIVLNDPLFLTPNSYITRFLWQESRRDESIEEKRDPATYYSKFILGLSQEESLPTNIKNEDHSYIHRFEWKNKEYLFRIKTSHADPDIQKPGIREGGKTKVGSIYGEKMKNGNIYFTRHQREISSGHYGFYNLSAENNRWWTIELDFD